MLLLTRKKDEAIILTIPEGLPAGTRIRICAVELMGNKVRIGIEAPKEIEINRDEIQRLVDRERDEAGGGR